jgi:peptidyl-prolyl cis-trans isomerase D
MSKSSTSKIVTKKHKARLERDNQQRKMYIIIAAVIFAAIILVLVYGVIDQTVLQYKKPVAKVGDQVIRADDFITMVKFQRYQLNQQAYQYQSLQQLFASDPNNASQFDSYIQQIKAQMDNSQALGGQVLDTMINDVIINKYAKENGITVTDEEVKKALQDQFGYYPEGTPTPANTPTLYATSTLNPTQKAIITETPTLEPTTTLEPTVVNEAEATPQAPTEVPTAMPTATAYTESAYQENYQAMITRFSEIDFTENDILKLMHNQLISEKVKAAVVTDVPSSEEQVWARHILVATLEEALAVKQRLNNGEDFAALAAELSTDTATKDKGGDLGWFGKGVMDPAFEEAAYGLQVGEISNPVQSQFGYHIIQLLGKEIRPQSTSRIQQLEQTAFSDWLTAQKAEITIEKYDNVWQKIVPTTPSFMDQPAQ